MLIKKSQAILKHFIDLKFSLRFTLHGGAPNGSVPQNICSSGNILLAGRFRKINMSLDGKCWWEIDISGCLRGFGVRNSPPPTQGVKFRPLTTPITFRIPPLLSLKSWILPYDHTQTGHKQVSSNVSTNVCWETSQEVWLQVVGAPCWLGTLPSVLLGVRNGWIFTSNIPNCLTWYQKALVERCCCFQVFSQNFPLGAPDAVLTKRNHVLWHLELFSGRLPVKFVKTLNYWQSTLPESC